MWSHFIILLFLFQSFKLWSNPNKQSNKDQDICAINNLSYCKPTTYLHILYMEGHEQLLASDFILLENMWSSASTT